MRLRCRFTRLRPGPYGAQGEGFPQENGQQDDVGCPSAMMVAVPSNLLVRGTVHDLVRQLGAAAGAGEEGARLAVGGYALPPSEPLARVLREDDEVVVHLPGSDSAPWPTARQASQHESRLVPFAAPRPGAAAAGDQAALLAQLAAVAEARAVRVEALETHIAQLTQQLDHAAAEAAESACEAAGSAQAREEMVKALEKQVAQLTKQLNDKATALASLRSAGEATGPQAREEMVKALEKQVAQLTKQLHDKATAPASLGSAGEATGPQVPTGAMSSSTWVWTPAASLSDILAGDIVRYRILLVDAWRGRPRKSPRREAAVFKLDKQPGDASGGGVQLIVLKHPDGALDCLEASRLLDLHVRRRAPS